MGNIFWDTADADMNKDVHAKEWVDMPEFLSEDRRPIQQIIVSFNSYDDVKKFANLIGIEVTPKTKSTYYPPRMRDTGEVYISKYWNDEK